jgi:threonine aldolase
MMDASVRVIDLRSDTATVPDAIMRRHIATAEVGDDVFGEDPTVIRLEALAAELTGKAKGLFVTSGTQGNLVALLTHCGRGDAALVGRESHIHYYEGGGLAVLGGIMPYALDDRAGIPSPEEVEAQLLPANVHYAPRRLLCLENTHNRCGGLAVPPARFQAVVSAARKGGLRLHLDGARLFNACVRWAVPPTAYTSGMDSVQLCLSKGLGAPVGSLLCGDADFIDAARHWRKRLGGGLRQAGILAAAGLDALTRNRARLAQDHENAARLADLLSAAGLRVEETEWRTNMVFFAPAAGTVATDELVRRCEAAGLRLLAMGPSRIRAVLHLDIRVADVDRAAQVIIEGVL